MTSLTTINNNNATSSTTTTNINNNNNNNNNNNTTNNNKDKYAIAAQQALALAASTNSKAIIKKRKTMESGVSSSGVWRSATTNRTVKAWCKPTSFTKPFYFISLADTQLGMVQGALGSTFLPLVGWKGGNSTAAIYDAEKEMSKLTVKYINKREYKIKFK